MKWFYLQENHYYGIKFKKKFILFINGTPQFLDVGWCRSIELNHLSGILSVFEDYYIVETGYRKVPHGGYKSEYKLSIPKSQLHNRINRFKSAINVTSFLTLRLIVDKSRVRVYSSWTSCETTPSHTLDIRKESTVNKINPFNPSHYTDNPLSKTNFGFPYSCETLFYGNVPRSKENINVKSYSRKIYKSSSPRNEINISSLGSWRMVYFKFIHVLPPPET